MTGVEFVKGHGTENDFVVLPDPDGVLELTEARVQALCDRQRGLGADGVLRVVRAAHVAGIATDPATAAPGAVSMPGDTWFMDYRNADGSIAEMCGNGVRVFAAYLVGAGLVQPGELLVGTRAGLRPTWVRRDGVVTVDMGKAQASGLSTATIGGQAFEGVAVDVGNPHLACVIDHDLVELDLTAPPGYDPVAFPHGVNIEFVEVTGPDSIRMRVYERGVGETRSCGTGTVAATVAALRGAGHDTGRRVVEVLGGAVEVEIRPDTALLTGPTALVARGVLAQAWWDNLSSSSTTNSPPSDR